MVVVFICGCARVCVLPLTVFKCVCVCVGLSVCLCVCGLHNTILPRLANWPPLERLDRVLSRGAGIVIECVQVVNSCKDVWLFLILMVFIGVLRK